jgi:hypothetical protein
LRDHRVIAVGHDLEIVEPSGPEGVGPYAGHLAEWKRASPAEVPPVGGTLLGAEAVVVGRVVESAGLLDECTFYVREGWLGVGRGAGVPL